MTILIKAFSSVRTICGFSEKRIEINEESVGDILQQLFSENKNLADIKDKLLFAINEEYCDKTRMLKDGDTLAVFPPVSGG